MSTERAFLSGAKARTEAVEQLSRKAPPKGRAESHRSWDEWRDAVVDSAADVPKLLEIAAELEEEVAGLREDRQRLLSENGAQRDAIYGLRDRLQRAIHAGHADAVPIGTCLLAACTELRKEFGKPFADRRTPLEPLRPYHDPEPLASNLASNMALALSKLSARVTALEVRAERAQQ